MICDWIEDDLYEGWDTGCGNRFILIDGTPSDNQMKFCPYCGGEIEEDRREQT